MDHKEFEQALCKKLGTTPDKATPQALHSAIGDTVMETIAPDWRASRQAHGISGGAGCAEQSAVPGSLRYRGRSPASLRRIPVCYG